MAGAVVRDESAALKHLEIFVFDVSANSVAVHQSLQADSPQPTDDSRIQMLRPLTSGDRYLGIRDDNPP
ncbi:hypothetical protein B7486_02305 [cyanobacterium TDX16]|nr:hypothetical protein B7486_02305 [cyanobacterium TDX16]